MQDSSNQFHNTNNSRGKKKMSLEEIFSQNDSETRKCKLEGCPNTFQVTYKGRKRQFCCDEHKLKDYRIRKNQKVKEYDFVRFKKQKLVALLSTENKKKAKEWGLLI